MKGKKVMMKGRGEEGEVNDDLGGMIGVEGGGRDGKELVGGLRGGRSSSRIDDYLFC